ncbi:hypothetical protein [uncultured Roseibium sp.]|uniref:hypothetical protein n=1 Tax=uncultured Roseibium sp. TaxID=1936171 RepID=UPI002638EDA6|nr:hypothetical protein [uncultured Roseibium sp.]
MKWSIVVVLVSGLYDSGAGGGTVTTNTSFDTLEECSIEAGAYIDDWRAAYKRIEDVKKQRMRSLTNSVNEQYSDEKIDAIEDAIKTNVPNREDVPAFLRKIGEEDLAKISEQMDTLKSWRPDKQARLANDAEAVCIPITD